MKLIALVFLAATAQAQFQILTANTTASLRGIDAVSPQIAWASGSRGTVLLTTDGGANWRHCAVPEGADKLDFRGVQAYDAKTAIIMASGAGSASAIYKTTDGCATWKLVFANPDANGFFDAIYKMSASPKLLYLMGDPVGGKFRVFYSPDGGESWRPEDSSGLDAVPGVGAFAASNSTFIAPIQTKEGSLVAFATGATSSDSPKVYLRRRDAWKSAIVPMPANGAASGIFSLAHFGTSIVAVGGLYTEPDETAGTAAYTTDEGQHWLPAKSMPSGYRSAVTFDEATKTWIAVGPSGSDFSRNHGMDWKPLKPGPADAPDADKNWNAISLPFVVGGKGKIGKLKAGPLTQ